MFYLAEQRKRKGSVDSSHLLLKPLNFLEKLTDGETRVDGEKRCESAIFPFLPSRESVPVHTPRIPKCKIECGGEKGKTF